MFTNFEEITPFTFSEHVAIEAAVCILQIRQKFFSILLDIDDCKLEESDIHTYLKNIDICYLCARVSMCRAHRPWRSRFYEGRKERKTAPEEIDIA